MLYTYTNRQAGKPKAKTIQITDDKERHKKSTKFLQIVVI